MKPMIPARGTPAYQLFRALIHDYADEERPCAQDPELWWMTDYAHVREAKERCKGTYSANAVPCPLLDICGRYAILGNEKEGVWGGMSPEDRGNVRRKLHSTRTALNKKLARARARMAKQNGIEEEEEQAS